MYIFGSIFWLSQLVLRISTTFPKQLVLSEMKVQQHFTMLIWKIQAIFGMVGVLCVRLQPHLYVFKGLGPAAPEPPNTINHIFSHEHQLVKSI